MWETLLSQGMQLGMGFAQGAIQQSGNRSAQLRQLGQQFDAMAGEVTRRFDQVQSKSVITVADVQALVAAYQQLAQVAQQYESAVPYIAEQWYSIHYKPAYEQRLRDIAARVNSSGAGANALTVGGANGGTNAAPQFASALSTISFQNPLVWLGVGLLASRVLR